MALKPMNDTVFGDLISEDSFDELTNMLHELTRDYEASLDSANLKTQIGIAERQIKAQLAKKNKLHFMVTVTAVGPDCRELHPGDTAILPPHGGTMVTVINENNEPQRVFAIKERAVLARWREE